MNYLVLAMKRSGHHTLTNWIKAHTKQKFYNNCCHGWGDKMLLTMIGKSEAKSGIANIEDFNPKYWDICNFPLFPFVQNCIPIVFARSLDNWLASCFARKYQTNEERKDVYKYLKKPYINDSKLRSESRIDLHCKLLVFASKLEESNKGVFITFDDFIKNEDYRKIIADKLQFKWNAKADKSISVQSKYGGGSSFYGTQHNIFNRHKLYEKNEEFQELLQFARIKMTETLKSIGKI